VSVKWGKSAFERTLVSFENYAEQNVRPLLRTATAICGDRSLAEDLVQEVLLRVQIRWAKIGGLEHRDAYIRRMLVNEFLSSRRRRRSRAKAELRASEPDFAPDHASEQADRAAMRALLTGLPRQQQVVLALRYYAGLSDEETAEALRCKPGTVRSYASRALATLRLNAGKDLLENEGRGRP
jgi:RNA polymerase sigma-70 factor (sigma-E family)